VPAILMMGLWLLTQFLGLGQVSNAMGGGGGVAYWAHIGGFIGGIVLVWFFRGRRRSLDVNQRYEQYRWEWPGNR
ncbi:MAG: rhomboid family intramembrane serine protease, partial [Dehalococcoidia bacterium]